ncbi:hypothetical protein SAMN05421541_107168 [Actinoplanes philippinensis]|uniref:Methyltransferase domain-containing protein n=2 Tax=Actinoplanes philippinensis TaxID=35752 RepID=A0A1I2GVD5_9ACTN|nr:hypothetical protein SAMN05421541_107168 [Actinoplanes philippinensis]
MAVLDAYRARWSGTDRAVFLPAQAMPDLARSIAPLVGNHVQQIVALPEVPDPDDYIDMVWRSVALDGKLVRRLYLLPNRALSQQAIDRIRAADQSSGAETRFLPMNDVPFAASTPQAFRRTWLIDDSTLIVETVLNGLDGWRVTAGESEVSEAVSRWRALWNLGLESPRTDMDGPNLEEPLTHSADLMNEVAHVLCTGSYIDRSSCEWYHAAWQYLRVFDMVSTPTWHSEFYQEAFNSYYEKERPDLLICGTADYSLLSYVISKRSRTKDALGTTVLDRCPTPLFACRWYANRLGLGVMTLEDDVLNPTAMMEENFDIIATDAFLTRFTRRDSRRVKAAWYAALKPGGVVITTVRLPRSEEDSRDEVAEASAFAHRARRRAEKWRSFLKVEPREIYRMAETYARRMHSHDQGAADAILSDFGAVGFSIVHSETADVPGELMPARYLRVIAAKESE